MIVRSIRTKIMLTYFATIFVASWLTGTLVLGQMRGALIQEKSQTMLLSANIAAIAGSEHVGGPDERQELRNLARDLSSPLSARVLFLNLKGEVIADAYGEMEATTISHPLILAAQKGESETAVRSMEDGMAIYAAVPVFTGQQIARVVFLSADLRPVLSGLDPMRRLLFLGSVIGGIAAGALGYLFASNLTHPLRRLALAARQLSRGRMDAAIDVPNSSDEVSDLALAFRQMLEHLKREERMRHMFVENASHELRSPLASLRALAQSLLDDPDPEPSVYKEFLLDMDGEIDRIDGLARGLLDLTRSQALSSGFKREPVNVAFIVEKASGRLEGMIRERGASVEIEGTAIWPLEPYWFGTAIYNLLHNAFKYSPEEQGRVSVRISEQDKALVVEIGDNGEGIPEGDLPHVFDRFYRVDKARARKTGGSGLGLSIVRHVVEAHGGAVTVESEMGKGSLFRLTIP